MKPPLYQLFFIHPFIKNGDNTKQISLVFAIMSVKRTDDYIAVLKSIHSLLLFLSLEECVTDYEPALSIAVGKVFENVKIIGYAFHFSQAVYRKLSEIVLSNRYKNNPGTNKFCKKLMTLVYLPPLHIVPMFDKFRHSLNESDFLLAQLCDHFERTWLKVTI